MLSLSAQHVSWPYPTELACIRNCSLSATDIIVLVFCVEDSIRLFLGDDDLAFYHGEFDPSFYQDRDRLTRGRVEYCFNQTYHGICGDDWGFPHASVVCRQLGFSQYGMLHYPHITHFLQPYMNNTFNLRMLSKYALAKSYILTQVIVVFLLGAIAVTEGYFSSSVLPLLPSNSRFLCDGSEQGLSECKSLSHVATDDECTRDDAGVVCQCQSKDKFSQFTVH